MLWQQNMFILDNQTILIHVDIGITWNSDKPSWERKRNIVEFLTCLLQFSKPFNEVGPHLGQFVHIECIFLMNVGLFIIV